MSKEDIVGEIIAEVAKKHGVALSRDDPILAVVWLNQAILGRYMEDTVAPVASAIRDATDRAVLATQEASLRAQDEFLSTQKTLVDAWKADMQQLINSQNAALREVVMHTAMRLSESKHGSTTALKSGWLWGGFLAGAVVASVSILVVIPLLWR